MRTVWITRPQPDAAAMVPLLEAIGWRSVVDPLLQSQACVDAGLVDQLAASPGLIVVTSRNAVRALTHLGPLPPAVLCQRVFAVGEGSGAEAEAAGFGDVVVGAGRGGDLVGPIMAAQRSTGLHVSYLRGADVAFDLTGALRASGVPVAEHIVYQTIETAAPAAMTSASLASGQISAIVLMSPRTATLYGERMVARGLAFRLPHLTHYCLSRSVADALAATAQLTVSLPSHPNLQEMLAVMGGPAAQSVH